jgi:hypothetical protein
MKKRLMIVAVIAVGVHGGSIPVRNRNASSTYASKAASLRCWICARPSNWFMGAAQTIHDPERLIEQRENQISLLYV